MSLVFMMASCNADYSLTVSESTEEVRVDITEQNRHSSLWCDEGAGVVGPVQLRLPLGDRVVIDSVRDLELPVRYWPWNQTRYSEAEYRAALEATGQCVVALESEATVAITTSDDGYPFLHVELPDVADGQSGSDPAVPCFEEHVEPLQR